jgi:cbb3-type cytochrome oxidase subunit 3
MTAASLIQESLWFLIASAVLFLGTIFFCFRPDGKGEK